MPLTKTSKMQLLELRFGVPIEDLLAEAILEHSSITLAAETLEISRASFLGWLRLFGINTWQLRREARRQAKAEENG
jgi:hypothetical protein